MEVRAVPIYEYRCEDCGNHLEVMQSFSEEPLRECRECGGSLRKLISNTSFVLKGSGWYADGYSAPPPKASEKPKEAGKGGEAKKDKTTDKKTSPAKAGDSAAKSS
jgi:putative FmdB family regulatory protein